jgi:UDP-N-acetylglucosamine 1-carboxyvinyltransferase
MKGKFIIEGKHKLSGSIDVFGAKNAVLPILAASVLSKKKIIIDNIPVIEDVITLIDILKSIGVKVVFLGKKKIEVDAENIDPENIDYNLISKIRSSVLLLSALSSRADAFKITVPGGCQLGARILAPHIDGFKILGIKVKKRGKFFEVINSHSKKKNREVVMSEMSVTATENIIIASVLLFGTTKIYGAASDPYVSDLCHFLNSIGAKISGVGSHELIITGVHEFTSGKHFIMYDPIEMGTFIALAAGTKSHLTVKNVIPNFIRLELLKFKEANVRFKFNNKRIFEKGWGYEICDVEVFPSELKAVKKVHNMPYPGFAADILPIFAALMTQAKGVSLVHDWMYEGRMKYIEELNRMGADAFVCDPHRALITGPEKLEGKDITSFDLRSGATMIIAALMASGKSVISNAYQVDRGYAEIEKRLKKIGAKIKRIK